MQIAYNYKFKINFKNYLFLGFGIFFLSLIINIKAFFLIIFFSMINALFLTYERYVEIPLDLEFSTISTIFMTISFGLTWGIMTAISTKIAHVVYNKDFNMNTLFSMLGYIIVALLSQFYSPKISIVLFGIMILTLVNIFNYVSLKYLNGLSDYEVLSYTLSNFIFNLILISSFSRVLMFLV